MSRNQSSEGNGQVDSPVSRANMLVCSDIPVSLASSVFRASFLEHVLKAPVESGLFLFQDETAEKDGNKPGIIIRGDSGNCSGSQTEHRHDNL